MKTFKNILPYALLILGLIIWYFWGNGNGHFNQSNAWDYLALTSCLGGFIILFKRYVL